MISFSTHTRIYVIPHVWHCPWGFYIFISMLISPHMCVTGSYSCTFIVLHSNNSSCKWMNLGLQRILTCDCGLLAPMPLHSARPRMSVPRVSRHKPPCLSTLDTASCSGTLRETFTERREVSGRSYYNREERMDWTDSLPRWVTESHRRLIRLITTSTHKDMWLQFEKPVIWRDTMKWRVEAFLEKQAGGDTLW